MDTASQIVGLPLSICLDMDIEDARSGKGKYSQCYVHGESITSNPRISNSRLRKTYLLLDSLHGPKETDIEMLEILANTGLAHQLVLTKLDRSSATLWYEIKAALKDSPTPAAAYQSSVRTLPGEVFEKSVEELEMGVWAPLRGKLGLGCDDTILGVSSLEGWGLTALRCSILTACGAFRLNAYADIEYAKALERTPLIETDSQNRGVDELMDQGYSWQRPVFADDNPMRGGVFGGEKMLRKKIYRW